MRRSTRSSLGRPVEDGGAASIVITPRRTRSSTVAASLSGVMDGTNSMPTIAGGMSEGTWVKYLSGVVPGRGEAQR
jgi:hypothetical protein